MMIGSNSAGPQPLPPQPGSDPYATLPQAELAMRLRVRDADYAKLKASYVRVGIAAAAFGVLSIALGIAHMVRR